MQSMYKTSYNRPLNWLIHRGRCRWPLYAPAVRTGAGWRTEAVVYGTARGLGMARYA